MKSLLLLFAHTSWICIYPAAVSEHSQNIAPPVSATQGEPARCETNNAILDVLAQKTMSGDLIIVIARPGDKEKAGRLSQRRLHNVRTYLTEYITVEGGRRKQEAIILAEGERVKGYGRIEFYVGGKLLTDIKVRRNADLIVGTCYRESFGDICALPTDKDFYPCRDLVRNMPRR